jgi:alpha-ketoglutaric semialdehyde dehydrogenase
MVASQPGEALVASNIVDGARQPGGAAADTRLSPVDGRVLGTYPLSSRAHVEAAVASARKAYREWARRTVVERGAIVRSATRALEDHADELIDLVCAETGKPRRDSAGELSGAVEMGYFIAGEGRRFYGRTTTSGIPHKSVSLVRSPIGVAGLIVAANTPLPNYAWKVFPALLCGNAVVLKPSEHTPFSATRFVELLLEAGVPDGVVNLVHGHGPETGQALVESDVDLVSFTGSDAVGRSIAGSAGARLIKTCLELGGKNPLVVCDDADLGGAINAATMSAFSNAGQRCAAASRIIVMDAVYDEFRAGLVERARRLVVGSGPTDDLGPVVSRGQLDRMIEAVSAALSAGATLLCGGEQLTGDGYDGGNYLAPTLLEVTPGDPLANRELFGPVACLYRVRTFDEAVALADDTAYGLTAAIWTSNTDRAAVFVEEIQAGMVAVNGPTYGSEPHMPFGGFRQSGNGYREAGTEVLDVYSEWKSVAVLHDPLRT